MVRVKPQMTAAHRARPKAWLPAPSDQCVQRPIKIDPTASRSVTHTEAVHRGTRHRKENSTLDKHARSEKLPFTSDFFLEAVLRISMRRSLQRDCRTLPRPTSGA
jgi:hypothetical protein